ncbi:MULTISPECIES: carboxymuconolactone decarboxylase family protein [Alteromonas]|jgi:alkylhydroperoxidase family enzyme|nr:MULTISPECIES: carboxymuconolactone decarboxylase family protein [Alteromonas]MAF72079.1 carboxymuconolactone decarboxylase family protein [Alteromonas sp.]MBU35267.1 carboxymuconolactone decarboxylase family protein [Alteromonas sp.]MCZ4240000.1 carboxymuconolactone decarboxylase family protein [Alteromonas macleodii]QPL49299.1 carboxymuconolactone decarboxylase family protein [Alteromonas sp. B31-7]|tara:strand:+ start:1702 stop:2256 length:555 start_codon:yes stop_codon:yes gene_type:complete
MMHKLNPIRSPFNKDVEAILMNYPKGPNGYTLKLFRVFANSLRFLAGKGVVNLLDEGSPLSANERELVILRVTANLNCEYEWGLHVSVFSEAAGLSKEQVAKTKTGCSTDPVWAKRQSLLLKCVDEICDDSKVHETTYAQFQKTWDVQQQLEILALCGNYHTVSFVANTSRVEREDFSALFPSG